MIDELVQMEDAEFEEAEQRYLLGKVLRAFGIKMARKLSRHVRDEDGRLQTNWNNEEWVANIHAALCKALEEGDYVSVANYSLMLDNLGYNPKGKAGS